MEIIGWKDVATSTDLSREFLEKVRSSEFLDKLIGDYGAFPKDEYYLKDGDGLDVKYNIGIKLCSQLSPIYHALKGNFSKKRVLDLGCGSASGTYESMEFDPKDYEPWLCRALSELGASPIGVDIGDLRGEVFEHYTKNLLLPNSLDFIGDNSIDVAHAGLLYDSPTLERMGGFRGLRELLIPQLERIVKSDGFLVEGV